MAHGQMIIDYQWLMTHHQCDAPWMPLIFIGLAVLGKGHEEIFGETKATNAKRISIHLGQLTSIWWHCVFLGGVHHILKLRTSLDWLASWETMLKTLSFTKQTEPMVHHPLAAAVSDSWWYSAAEQTQSQDLTCSRFLVKSMAPFATLSDSACHFLTHLGIISMMEMHLHDQVCFGSSQACAYAAPAASRTWFTCPPFFRFMWSGCFISTTGGLDCFVLV